MKHIFGSHKIYYVLVGLLMLFVSMLSARYDESFTPTKGAVNVVYVHGAVVTAKYDGTRFRSSCPGATADRRMVTFYDAEHTRVKDEEYIIEHDIADPAPGGMDVWLTLHLASPLPENVKGPWFMRTIIYSNCPLWLRILPAFMERQLVQRPIVINPVPVTNDPVPAH